MNAFPWVLNGVVEAWISAGRIYRIFETDESALLFINPAFDSDRNLNVSIQGYMNPELIMKSSLVYWQSIDNPTLTDINLTISKVYLPKCLKIELQFRDNSLVSLGQWPQGSRLSFLHLWVNCGH